MPQLESLLKFHLTQPEGLNLFTGYGDDYVVINGERYTQSSLLITPDAILTDWQVADFHTLTAEHFATIAALRPEIALLGTGAHLQFPHPRLSIALSQVGIGLEVMDTKAACRTYNILVAEGRRVIVGILLN